jgi:hypothetical protein
MIRRANYPDNHVIGAIRRRDKRRAGSEPSRPVYPPSRDHGRWIGCSNTESVELVLATATSNICSQVSTVSGRRLDDRPSGNLECI